MILCLGENCPFKICRLLVWIFVSGLLLLKESHPVQFKNKSWAPMLQGGCNCSYWTDHRSWHGGWSKCGDLILPANSSAGVFTFVPPTSGCVPLGLIQGRLVLLHRPNSPLSPGHAAPEMPELSYWRAFFKTTFFLLLYVSNLFDTYFSFSFRMPWFFFFNL